MHVGLDSLCPDGINALHRIPSGRIIQQINELIHSAKWYVLHVVALHYVFIPGSRYETDFMVVTKQMFADFKKGKYIA
jgi:hypothetical protein